jgi:hypothetical protein
MGEGAFTEFCVKYKWWLLIGGIVTIGIGIGVIGIIFGIIGFVKSPKTSELKDGSKGENKKEGETKVETKKFSKDNLPFFLQKGEKLLDDNAGNILYHGVGEVTTTFGFGGVSDSGLAGGMATSSKHKRQGSIFDATPAHMFATNKRLTFVKENKKILGIGQEGLGNLFADIPYEQIESINPSVKFNIHPSIDLGVRKGSELDMIKITFAVKKHKDEREEERDQWIKFIRKQK